MARFLVTSGAKFTPFTYDELVKPLEQMTTAHREAQEAYDTLGASTAALEQYMDDDESKAIYDNYMQALQQAQDSLWRTGYSGATTRALSQARNRYASDILRLDKAVKDRDELSREYAKIRHEHPEMVMGEDPGSYSISNYYRNPNFGRDYYNISGTQFADEVAAEMKAAASALRDDVTIPKELKGYLVFKETQGFTNEEMGAAYELLRAREKDPTLRSSDYGVNLIVDILENRLNATGARDKVDATEWDRLVRYGMLGARQGILGSKTSLQKDWILADNMQEARAIRAENRAAAREAAKAEQAQKVTIPTQYIKRGGNAASSNGLAAAYNNNIDMLERAIRIIDSGESLEDYAKEKATIGHWKLKYDPKDIGAARWVMENYSQSLTSEGLREKLKKTLEAQDKAAFADSYWLSNAYEGAQKQMKNDYVQNAGINKETIQQVEWADKNTHKKPVTLDEYLAMMGAADTEIGFDPNTGKWVAINNGDAMLLPRMGFNHTAVPINENVWSSLDENAESALSVAEQIQLHDLVKTVPANGGFQTTLSADKVASFLSTMQRDIYSGKYNAEQTAARQEVINWLTNVMMGAVYQSATSKHQGPSLTGDDSKQVFTM